MESEQLNVKQLAAALGKHTSYVYRMRQVGFKMPGGTCTVGYAYAWIRDHQFKLIDGVPCYTVKRKVKA